jgi:hypothetical protein
MEVPHDEYNYYETNKLIKHLSKHGFERVNYIATLFTDGK